MKNYFVILFGTVSLLLFYLVLSNSDTKRSPNRICIHLMYLNYDADVHRVGNYKKGDTVVLKRTVRQSLKYLMAYSPSWVIDQNPVFQKDTEIYFGSNQDTIIYYAIGLVK